MTSASLARSGADPNRTISALERYPELAGPDRIEAELARHWHAVADRQPDSALLAAWRAANAAFRSLA